MKFLINGQEWQGDLILGVNVTDEGDRKLVNTADGMKSALVVRRGEVTFVSYDGRTYEVRKPGSRRGAAGGAGGGGEARAPMPGQIVDLPVSVGDRVKVGDKLVVLEAMKMQQGLATGIDGVVKEVNVAVGDQVSDGQLLVLVVEEEA